MYWEDLSPEAQRREINRLGSGPGMTLQEFITELHKGGLMKETTARKVVLIQKVRKLIEKEGYQFATTGTSAPAKRCPVCGKPSMIKVMRQGEDISTARILGFCFNRMLSKKEACTSKTFVLREEVKACHSSAK
jgi:hypothetical protein